MINITFNDGQFKTEKKGFVQYDYGQTVKVIGLEASEERLIFQFIKDGSQVDMFGTLDEDGNYTVQVPDEFLQNDGDITLYCFYETQTEGHTEKCAVIDVLSREMYPPTSPQPHEDVIAYILDELVQLQNEIDNWTIPPETLAAIVEEVKEEVEAQIDLTNYYDKTETDALLATKADKNEIPDVSDYYTKQEVDTALSGKVDDSDLNDYYTKTQTDGLLQNKANVSDIPDVSGLATKQELTTGLAGKADAATTYTKNEVDTALNGKANASDLNNYYTKSQTYTQAEVNALINAISTLDIQVVNVLPTQNISTTTSYLVPSQDPQTSNAKDEYINLDGTSAGWELIGSTSVDLTGYVTSTQLATILADYVTASSLATTLSDYITSSGLTTILADYVTSANLTLTLADYATTSAMNTALANKADASTTYTKTEVDNLLSAKASQSDLTALANRVTDVENELDGVDAVLNTILNISNGGV